MIFKTLNYIKVSNLWSMGSMYGKQISPLIAFIFYLPVKLKKKMAMVKGIFNYPVGLNGFHIHSFFVYVYAG